MDHKWGRNVTELGLGDVGATLAARVIGSPHVAITNAKRDDGTVDWWFYPTVDTPDLAYFRFPFTDVAHGNFPYGHQVEPDGRL